MSVELSVTSMKGKRLASNMVCSVNDTINSVKHQIACRMNGQGGVRSARTGARRFSWQMSLYNHTHANTHIHTCTHARTHAHKCMHTRTHTRTHAHAYASMHAVEMHVPMHTYSKLSPPPSPP